MDKQKIFRNVANELIAEYGFSEHYREPFFLDVGNSIRQIIVLGINDTDNRLLFGCNQYLHRGDLSYVSVALFDKMGTHWCIYNYGKIALIGRDKYGVEEFFPHNLTALALS